MPPVKRSKAKRDIDEAVEQTAAHAVANLAAPPPIVITPVRPVDPQPDAAAVPAQMANGHAKPAAPVTVEQVPEQETAQEPTQEPAEAETATDQAAEASTHESDEAAGTEAKPDDQAEAATTVEDTTVAAPDAQGEAAGPAPALAERKVRPTSNADCKGDPRRKHTINIAPEPYRRLGQLQLAETLRAGREQPLWPHIDAALAVLRRDECSDGELAAWAERGEAFADVLGDEYRQIGILLRRSVLEAVRTLRVRLRSVGADDVDVQAVLSAAIVDYLDALGAPSAP